ncbi:MAG TPA: ABC transporter substrate-binding protein [Firmicutes bacterium]|jgi:peptide/nickel transport system substrate-binding protein|nr:ABC transporter substrate-binding protein [Bacillota bacterium]
MKLRLGLAALVLLLTLAGSSSAFSAALNVAVSADPDTFDPTKTVAAATVEIAFNIYEGLVKAAPDGSLVGALATDWDVSPDQKTYTFTLRDAFFHNGAKVTAEDVVNALNRARDAEVSARWNDFALVEAVEGEGSTVVVRLSQPNAAFLYTLAEVNAAIYPKGAEGLAAKPIGTGPYKLAEWRPNQYVRLERFNEYWGEKAPYYDEVVFRIIPDEYSAVLNLLSGNVDLIPRMEASVYHQVANDSRIKVVAGPMNLVQILAINNQRPPFNDVRVRKALAMAVNREEIMFGAAWGFAQPLYSGLSPAMPAFFNGKLQEVNPYDPALARELLREAGVSNLKLTLTLPSDYPLHVQTGEIAAQQWEAIGIDVDIQLVEWGTWLEKVYAQRDYDVSIVGLAGRLDPHAILVRYTSGNSRNFFNFSSPEFDQLIEQGLVLQGSERVAVYHLAQEILAREVAGVFVMDPEQLAAMRGEIQGWEHYPIYVVDAARLYE